MAPLLANLSPGIQRGRRIHGGGPGHLRVGRQHVRVMCGGQADVRRWEGQPPVVRAEVRMPTQRIEPADS